MAAAPQPPLRAGRAEDGPVLARLTQAAGAELPLAMWRAAAGPGEDPWAIGAARQAARAEAGEATVIDEGAGPVAALIGRPLADPAPLPEGLPAPLPPLLELEALALGSWYVNILAALPEAQGRGLGSRLLEAAAERAAETGMRDLSLIAADANAGARRLYLRRGFEEIARRPMIAGPGWTPPGREWILMIRRGPFG